MDSGRLGGCATVLEIECYFIMFGMKYMYLLNKVHSSILFEIIYFICLFVCLFIPVNVCLPYICKLAVSLHDGHPLV